MGDSTRCSATTPSAPPNSSAWPWPPATRTRGRTPGPRWPGSPHLRSSRTWPSWSSSASAWPSASRWKTRSSPRGSSSATSSGSLPPGTLTDDAFLDAKTSELPGGRRRGPQQARPGVDRAVNRAVLPHPGVADRAGRRAGAGSTRLRSSSRRRAWTPPGPGPPRRGVAGGHGPAIVGLRPRAGPKVLIEQFRTTTLGGFGVDDEGPEVQAAARDRLPPRHPEIGHRPHRPAHALPSEGHPGPRRDDPPEPGADPHPPRRPPRGVHTPGDRPDLHADAAPACCPSGSPRP